MKASILKGVQAIMGFVDDQGEPMNENANSFCGDGAYDFHGCYKCGYK
jgi:hypothetical protein